MSLKKVVHLPVSRTAQSVVNKALWPKCPLFQFMKFDNHTCNGLGTHPGCTSPLTLSTGGDRHQPFNNPGRISGKDNEWMDLK